MSLFKYLIIAVTITLSQAMPLWAEESTTITIKRGFHTGDHLEAVGAVFAIDGKIASIGTGTYIGDKKILTAGHLFRSILPASVSQESGPVRIDISDKKVYWSNEKELDLAIKPATLYKAKYLTVDASFINNFKANLAKPDQNQVKNDLAILTLENSVTNVTEMSIPQEHSEMPTEGLLVGYGKNSEPHHKKHTQAQVLHGLMDLGQWGILMSNFDQDMGKNQKQITPEEQKNLELILGKSALESKDTLITRSTQGDSGGPLLIVTKNGDINIIGVMSAKSNMFNAFASLIVKTPLGFFRNNNLDALIQASK
jgi:hypothetical protein